MDHNPYESPAPVEESPAPLPDKRPRRRLPWMFFGLLVGIVVMVLLLPAVSDSTGTVQTVVILICLIGGPILGLLIDLGN